MILRNSEISQESSARRIAAGLGRLSLALKSKAWKAAADQAITPTQGALLAHLTEHPNGLSLGALAQKLGISAPTASDAVKTLVAKKLVAKKPGADKRAVVLTATEAGDRIAAQAGDWTEFLAEAVDVLDHAEQADFLVSLTKIIRSLQESGDISPQRLCVTCRHFMPFAHRDAVQPHHCRFVDQPFGRGGLRLNCADHDDAGEEQRRALWALFSRVFD